MTSMVFDDIKESGQYRQRNEVYEWIAGIRKYLS
jgi:hypothetical protein